MDDQPAPKRAFGRSLADFPDLSEAEKKLIEACAKGEVAEFGDGTRPGPLALLTELPEGRRPADVLGDFPALVRAGERRMRWRRLPRANGAAADAPRVWVRIVPLQTALDLPDNLPARIAVPMRWLRTRPESNWWGHHIGRRADRDDIGHPGLHDLLHAIRIRAGLLRFLLLGGDAQTPVHEQGVQMDGAWIAGALDLEACRHVRPLLAWGCRLDAAPVLRDARMARLALAGSSVPGIEGDRAAIGGVVFLGNGFHARGEVRLLGAAIGGDLGCVGGRFEAPGGNALSCDGATIGGTVFLSEGFHARGTVRLPVAEIGAGLDATRGRFEAPGGNVLSCDGATIGGNVFLGDGFVARGTVRLSEAEIGGDLGCVGGRFEAPGANALACDGATIGGAAFLRKLAGVQGRVSVAGVSATALVDDSA